MAPIPPPPRAPSAPELAPVPVIVLSSGGDLADVEDLSCSMCGTVNPGRLRYCQACGMTLRPSKPPISVSPVLAEALAVAEPAEVLAEPAPAVVPTEPHPLQIETPLSSTTDVVPAEAEAEEQTEAGEGVALDWRPRRTAAALALVGALAGALVLQHVARNRSVAPPTTATPTTTTPLPEPAADPAPSPQPEIPSGMGLLKTVGAPPGHRIFVDGRAVGQTPRSVLVKCGPVRVKIGSAGHSRDLEVPCGEEVAFP
jgi:hypothetical protein